MSGIKNNLLKILIDELIKLAEKSEEVKNYILPLAAFVLLGALVTLFKFDDEEGVYILLGCIYGGIIIKLLFSTRPNSTLLKILSGILYVLAVLLVLFIMGIKLWPLIKVQIKNDEPIALQKEKGAEEQPLETNEKIENSNSKTNNKGGNSKTRKPLSLDSIGLKVFKFYKSGEPYSLFNDEELQRITFEKLEQGNELKLKINLNIHEDSVKIFDKIWLQFGEVYSMKLDPLNTDVLYWKRNKGLPKFEFESRNLESSQILLIKLKKNEN